MVLHTYMTPRNNEFKERIKETRYMSYNDTISDDIKKLMDIDIVRDLANKAMYLNDKLPYDVASMNAKQIYLGEPIKGIEIPLIEEEEDIDLTSDGLYIENPNFKVESFEPVAPVIPEPVVAAPVIKEPVAPVVEPTAITNPESIYSEEYLKEQKKQEMIIDSSFVDELISEPNTHIEEEVIDSSFVDKLITEPDASSVIANPAFVNQNEDQSSFDNSMIIENINHEEIISEPEKIDLIIENPIKEEIIMEEPIKEEVIGEEIIMEDSVEEEIIEETDELEKTFDLSNMLSELPVGMLDEIPTKDMLEELPIGEEPIKENGLIMSTDLLDSLQKENTNDLLDIINTDFENVKYTDLITNKQEMPKKEIILEKEPLINEELPDLISNEEPLLSSTSLDEDLLEELPEVTPKEDLFEELPKEEVKEELINPEKDLFGMAELALEENKNDLLESLDVDNLINDIKLEDTKEDLLEELPKLESKDELLEPLDINLEEVKEEPTIDEQLPDLNSNDEPLLPELPEVAPKEDLFEELPKEEVKEELLVEEPKKEDTNNLEDLSNLADNILATDTLTSFEPKKEELESKVEIQSIDASSQLLANLTNGFTMDFLDEPVMQKVKTR